MRKIDVYSCGVYKGFGRGDARNLRTSRLLRSKYHANQEERARIVKEMTDAAAGIRFDVITYALAKNSGTQHARALARSIAAQLDKPIIAPSSFAKHDLTKARILIIDDVLKTGRTIHRIALKLIPNAPASIAALVYLRASKSPGRSIL